MRHHYYYLFMKNSLPNEIDDLKKDIIDLKEKNRVITQKFQACKKERDQLKVENKELLE